jgi:hypothetical protein
MILSDGREILFFSQVFAMGPKGKDPCSLIEMLRIPQSPKKPWGGLHTRSRGPGPSIAPRSNPIPREDCHYHCHCHPIRLSGRQQTRSQPVLVPAIGSRRAVGEPRRLGGARSSSKGWRVALPPELNRALPIPSRPRKTLAVKRSPRHFADVLGLLVHFGETH